ncbi:hypothetical protein [Nocardioides sp. InS609-2]|uniref:hypothetical protein n=1 Tax=Nocardioides sp. InS609-2 TaxID=2760705 RepID=UPI0020BE8E26|nr:hypothetical protein [Nocardioides sp. InS609-2]
MSPYLSAVPSGSWEDALHLYDWNVHVGAAFFEDLHYLEVGLRNAMDLELEAWASQLGCSDPWYSSRQIPLNPRSRRAARDAQQRATDDGQVREVHGKVIAELSFGFWWSLLADRYNRTLWAPCLKNAFDGPVRRQKLHESLDELRRLRNRIAHHEPLHARNLHGDHQLLLDTASRVAAPLRQHIESVSRVTDTLGDRP